MIAVLALGRFGCAEIGKRLPVIRNLGAAAAPPPQPPRCSLLKFTNPRSIPISQPPELVMLTSRQTTHSRDDDRERITRARHAAEDASPISLALPTRQL
jgi:hypothetical protein